MLYYPPLDAPGTGQVPPVGPAACASGGWFMTPREMLQVLHGLDDGAILAAGPKRAINEGCLGWHRCPTSTSSHWKGGDWEHADAGFATYLGTIIGIPVVAVMNSPARSWDLNSVIANAQITATTPAR